MNNETQPQDSALVVANVEQAKVAIQRWQELKAAVLTDTDKVEIQGKTFIKRSGWRKIALAFNITTQILNVDMGKDKDSGDITVAATVRALAKNGRFADEVGVCTAGEFKIKDQATAHNIETKAVTRAINRAISDLVGGGDLETDDDEGEQSQKAHDTVLHKPSKPVYVSGQVPQK